MQLSLEMVINIKFCQNENKIKGAFLNIIIEQINFHFIGKISLNAICKATEEKYRNQ
jgi:hypothetical protein